MTPRLVTAWNQFLIGHTWSVSRVPRVLRCRITWMGRGIGPSAGYPLRNSPLADNQIICEHIGSSSLTISVWPKKFGHRVIRSFCTCIKLCSYKLYLCFACLVRIGNKFASFFFFLDILYLKCLHVNIYVNQYLHKCHCVIIIVI